MAQAKGSYRKQAFDAYPPICVYCCFGIAGVLEVAHMDQNHQNNSIDNLALMCPTCHRMHDVGLIPPDVVKTMRDNKKEIRRIEDLKPIWALLVKDAGAKARVTKMKNAAKKRQKRSAAAKKANLTKKQNALEGKGITS
jgi:HNH endonuclease